MRNSIAVDHEFHLFNDKQYARFMAYLENVENNTVTFTVDSANQLLLDSEFKTVSGKSRLSWTALRQCCNYLSKSFYRVVGDLCGRGVSNKTDLSLYSDKDAASVFNVVVRRKLSKGLRNKRVLKNTSTNTIEALLTPKYKRLSNHVFMKRVDEAMKKIGSAYSFLQATVSGRKMQARFIFKEPLNLENLDIDNALLPVRAGVLFTNSEYGDSAVKLTLFLMFGTVGTTMVPYSASWSLDHKGKNFNGRLNDLLVALENKRKELDETHIEEMLNRLQSNNLGLSGVAETDSRWLKAVNKKLVSHKIHANTADKVLKRTLFSKVEDGEIVLGRVDKAKTWPHKTSLDMFVAMLTEGTQSVKNMTARDNIEQSSFRLLSGKLRI
jgi:hypothetical protein